MSQGILSPLRPKRKCVSTGQIVCLSVLAAFTTLLTFAGTSASIAAGIAIGLFTAVFSGTAARAQR